MNNVLEVKSLTKTYQDFTLDKISFSLPEGYIMGLIGPNGSGKTTTIKSILNMAGVDGGSITLFGKDNIAAEQEIKKEIGAVFDSSYFVDEWKMADVEKSFSLFYPRWNSTKYWDMLSRFRISRDKRVKELSKGMQMKLMLACVFSYDAKLLILDEPTSGLDPVSRDELLEILAEYIEDGHHSVLFSSHITSDLEKIADYITYLNLGNLIFSGGKEEFTDSYRIVSGNLSSLTPELEQKLKGIRKFSTGFAALFLIMLGQTALLSIKGAAPSAVPALRTFLLCLTLFSVYAGVQMPGYYRFGSIKGKMFVFVPTVGYLLFYYVGRLLNADGRKHFQIPVPGNAALAAGAVCLILLILSASAAVSVKIYKRLNR